MNEEGFLVARVAADALGETMEWLGSDEPPFEAIDPLDFLISGELVAAYEIYRAEYLRIDDRLNVGMPEALLEYNRWVLIVDGAGIVAFSCFKTTPHGLKLGLVAAREDAVARAAIRTVLRLGLNVMGVYGEVSEGVERVVAGRVPEVPPSVAAWVLRKPIEPHADGRHYLREITNVGPRTKLLVGNPVLD